MDGYTYWLMTDLPGGVEGDMNSCGIFDVLCRPDKFPDPAPVLRFNRETVLLVDVELGQRVLSPGTAREAGLIVPHYGSEAIRDGVVEWEVAGEGVPAARGEIRLPQVEVGSVERVGSVTLGPWQPDCGRKVRLSVRLRSAACEQSNEWDFWVFPARKRDFEGSGVVNLTGLGEVTRRYETREAGLAGAKVVLETGLTPEVAEYVAGGGRAVLLTERGGLARPLHFTYWPAWIRRIGNVVDDHPAVRAFPSDGFCGFQLMRLFGGEAGAVDLTLAGTPGSEKLSPIIWGLRADHDPALSLGWGDPSNRRKHYRAGLVC